MSEENKKDKFYKKAWFTYLLLVFITPIGILLLWINNNHSTKTKGILTAVFGVWFIVISVSNQTSKEEKAEEAMKQEQVEQDKAEEEAKEAEEKKEKEEAAKKEEEEEKERKANRSITEALEEDSNNVDEASLDDGELTLRFEPSTLWSENSLMGVVHDMFEEVKVAFDDEDVNSVLVMIEAEMTDEKGNESVKPVITYRYTREGFDELNYDNFVDMSLAEEWRILNESDEYYIHPGIRANLKDKYIQNLK